MMVGGVEVAGVLPSPATKANRGAADMLEAQLFAYGVGSSVAVVEVHGLQLACLLQGGHRNHAVTAVKWCPDCHSRDLKSHSSHLRLASGDSDGGVAVWSVLSGAVISRLEDHYVRPPASGRGASGSAGNADAAAAASGGGGGGGGGPSGAGGGGGGVSGLAWVLSSPCVLAVLLSPATLLLWDTKGGAVLWKREMTPSELWQGLEVDPLDCRRLAVTSAQGGLALVTFGEVVGERADIKQYRVQIGAATTPASTAATVAPVATFSARFCATRDLIFLLLPREIIVYDTELGTPAASRSLPPGRAPFSALLGVFGSGVSAGTGDEGGCDCLYVLHTDGGLSVLLRTPGELRYQLAASGRLAPPPLRGSLPAVVLLACCAGLWRGDGAGGGEDGAKPRPSLQKIEAATHRLRAAFTPDSTGADHSGRHETGGGGGGGGDLGSAFAAAAVSGHRGSTGGRTAAQHQPQQHPGGGSQRQHHHPAPPGSLPASAAAAAAAAAALSGGGGAAAAADAATAALRIVVLTGDGRVWRWDAPLPQRPGSGGGEGGDALAAGWPVAQSPPHSAQLREAPLHAPPPQLSGLLHTLPSAVTAFALYPRPVSAASPLGLAAAAAAAGGGGGRGVVLLGAAVTAGGSIELFTMQRGLVAPLSLHVSASLLCHRSPARGVRWLGATPRLATFSSDRGPHGWRNLLLLTDVRSGRSVPMRDRAGEAAPMLGMRASPCGCYLLVLFRGAAAELWGVWPGTPPSRLRLLDLPFSCVEWVQAVQPAHAQAAAADDVTSWDLAAEPAPPTTLPTPAVGGGAGTGGGRGRGSHDGGQWLDSLASSGGGGGAGGGGMASALVSGEYDAFSLPPPSTPPLARTAAARASAAPPSQPDSTASSFTATASTHPHALPPNPSTHPASSQAPPSPLPLPHFQPPHPAHPHASPHPQPHPAPHVFSAQPAEAFLAFTLSDGRAGVLGVRGRRVADTRVKRPMAGLLSPLDMAATAMAAWGRLAIMGDMEGRLAVWDMGTGRSTLLASGMGLVRKIHVGPPVPPTAATAGRAPAPAAWPHLPPSTPHATGGPAHDPATSASSWAAAAATARASLAAGAPPPATASPGAAAPGPYASATGAVASAPLYNTARVAVLFSTGQCAVFDLDSTNKLRPTAATAAAVVRAGVRVVLDLAWLPLSWAEAGAAEATAAGGGGGGLFLLVAVTDEGALSVLDVASPASLAHARPGGGSPLAAAHRRPFGAVSSRALALKAALQPPPQRAHHADTVIGNGGGGGEPWTEPAAEGVAGGVPSLQQAPSLGSCLLLPRPWAMLLRLLLQLGVSEAALHYLCGPYSPGEAEAEDVRLELLARVPRGARGPLLALLADQPEPGAAAGQEHAHAAAAAAEAAWGGPKSADAPVGWTLGLLGATPSQAVAAPPPAAAAAAAATTAAAAAATAAAGSYSLPGSMLRAVSYALSLSGLAGSPGGVGDTAITVAAAAAASGGGGAAAAGFVPAPAASEDGGGGVGVPGGGGAGGLADGGGGGGSAHTSYSVPYRGNMLHLLRMLAAMRAQGRLLHPSEWLSYGRALEAGACPSERMAVAAAVAGDGAEERFWSHLPATLAAVRDIKEQVTHRRMRDAAQSRAHSAAAAATAPPPAPSAPLGAPAAAPPHLHEPPPALRAAAPAPSPSGGAARGGGDVGWDVKTAASGSRRPHTAAAAGGRGGVLLWDEQMALAEAQVP